MCILALATASQTHAASISGWAVHNGTSTVGGTPASPTFTAGDNITIMAPFERITLDANGEFVKVTTTLTLNQRTANTGVTALNTQLRAGIFNGPDGSVVASDVPNTGYTIEYSNLAAGGLLRTQTSAVQNSPFTSPTSITNGSPDAGGDSIRGANPGAVMFEITMTRAGGLLNLTGAISGTDSTTGNPFLATFTTSGHSSTAFPANGAFAFNRIGLFLGPNVDATNAVVTNSTVTTNVPEPQTCLLAAMAAVSGMALKPRTRIAS